VIQGKYYIGNNANMELKNVNPTSGYVVASNLMNVNFLIFEKCEN
jgi:hypothetical protein